MDIQFTFPNKSADSVVVKGTIYSGMGFQNNSDLLDKGSGKGG